MKNANEVGETESEEAMKRYRELILFSHSKQLKVHLILKDKSWGNGLIKDVNPDFFMFEDRVNGPEPIFFLEVYKVEPFIEDKKEDEKDE